MHPKFFKEGCLNHFWMRLVDSTWLTAKNAIQYLIGFSLYLLVYGSFDPVKLALGLVSFLITYSAIYPYNDLMDYESDKKDKFKRTYKKLITGELSFNKAITLVFGLPLIGLMIASMVSGWYMLLLVILLFQNFLHSSPYTRDTFKKKKRYLIPNMFIMQLIKFSLGWFTFTTDITLLPVWVLNTFSLSYVFGYLLYKFGLLDMEKAIKNKLTTMVPLAILITVSYAISFLIYPFKIPLLLVIPVMFLVFTMSRQKNLVRKALVLSNISIIIIASLVVMFLLLNIPAVAQLNDNATVFFNNINEITLQKMDNSTYQIICKINETLYSYPIHDLKELNNILNITGTEIILRNETQP